MRTIKKAQFGARVGREGGRSCGLEKQMRKDERQSEREWRKLDRQGTREVKREERQAKREERKIPKQRSGGKIKPKASNVSKKLGSAKKSIGNMRFAKKKK